MCLYKIKVRTDVKREDDAENKHASLEARSRIVDLFGHAVIFADSLGGRSVVRAS